MYALMWSKEASDPEQVQLVWETLHSDVGLINLFTKKLVELKVAGLYNESAQAEIREYVLTQHRLNNTLTARINDMTATEVEPEKSHQDHLKRQTQREAQAARYGVTVKELPEHRKKLKEKAKLLEQQRQARMEDWAVLVATRVAQLVIQAEDFALLYMQKKSKAKSMSTIPKAKPPQ